MRLSDDIFGLLVVLAGLLMVTADLFREIPDVIGSIGAGLVAFSVLQVSEARKDRRLHLEQAAQAQIQAIEAHIRDLDETTTGDGHRVLRGSVAPLAALGRRRAASRP